MVFPNCTWDSNRDRAPWHRAPPPAPFPGCSASSHPPLWILYQRSKSDGTEQPGFQLDFLSLAQDKFPNRNVRTSQPAQSGADPKFHQGTLKSWQGQTTIFTKENTALQQQDCWQTEIFAGGSVKTQAAISVLWNFSGSAHSRDAHLLCSVSAAARNRRSLSGFVGVNESSEFHDK